MKYRRTVLSFRAHSEMTAFAIPALSEILQRCSQNINTISILSPKYLGVRNPLDR